MEFNKVITERSSCKKYDGRKITDDQLKEILEAGRMAPTAKNLQEYHVYVCQSDEALQMIDQVTPCRYNAGTVLIVAYDKINVYTYPGTTKGSGAEDASIVATHLMLGAKNAGVDSCWLNCFNPDKLAELMKLPENEEILMLLDLGYAAEDAVMNPMHGVRKPVSETTTYL